MVGLCSRWRSHASIPARTDFWIIPQPNKRKRIVFWVEGRCQKKAWNFTELVVSPSLAAVRSWVLVPRSLKGVKERERVFYGQWWLCAFNWDFWSWRGPMERQGKSLCVPTTLLPKQVGKMYTASLYAAFISLIHNKHSTLAACQTLLRCCMLVKNWIQRHEFPPEKFVETLKLMEPSKT